MRRQLHTGVLTNKGLSARLKFGDVQTPISRVNCDNGPTLDGVDGFFAEHTHRAIFEADGEG
jgi:hypothetical protein